MHGLRVLLVLPQLPQDPASGAARSTRTMCQMLAAAGAEVRAIATTNSESAQHVDAVEFLRGLGIEPTIHRGRQKGSERPVLEFSERGVHYRLLDVGRRDNRAWQMVLGSQFDQLFDQELHGFKPDLMVGFGGFPPDIRRYERARRQGVKLVFSLRNEGYLTAEGKSLLEKMDAILTPSEYLTGLYRAAIGVESTALPLPMELEEVVAEERDPIFFTMVNPSADKGLMVMARLAEELGRRFRDIPLLIVESRGSAGRLVQAGMLGGYDLRRHENLMMSPPLGQPKEIYAGTRVVLMPSLWQEPAGRVAAEALLNGIPPMVSNRGGLPETCNGAGFYLPIPPQITPRQPTPVLAEVVEPWLELMARLATDEEFYREECERALEAGALYRPEQLAPRYVAFFQSVLGM